MCLTITIQQEPLEVKRNVHCYKALSLNRDLEYETPYMNTPVAFKNGYFVQTAPEFGIKKWEILTRWGQPKKYAHEIYEGIHSYGEKKFINLRYWWAFHAVIPKGTQAFFSDGHWNKDLSHATLCVSLKLIVFKSYWYYLKYKLGLLKIEV